MSISNCLPSILEDGEEIDGMLVVVVVVVNPTFLIKFDLSTLDLT